MKLKTDLTAILLFSLLYRLCFFLFVHPHLVLYNSDSVSYFTQVDVFNGLIDKYRTPVYPYILKCLAWLSEKNLVRNLVFLQQIVSFLSIIPFYYVARRSIANRPLAAGITLFYGCWNSLLIQNVNINPECLCVAGTTMVLFLVAKYLESPRKTTAFFIGLFPLILVMLKPVYLVVLIGVLLFFLVRFILLREERKRLYWGALGWLVAVSGIWGYCEMNRKYNGDFVLSKVELINSLANVVISGAYKYGGDKTLIDIVDSTKQKGFYTTVFFLNNEYVDNYVRCNKRFPAALPPTDDMKFYLGLPDIVNYPYKRTAAFVAKSKHTNTYYRYVAGRMKDMGLNFPKTSLLVLFEIGFLFYAFIKQQKPAWMELLCILVISGQFIVIAIGGIDDIDRLLIPAYPCILLLSGAFGNVLLSFLNRRKILKPAP